MALHPFPTCPTSSKSMSLLRFPPLFANRLLARSRPEYEDYLTWSGFSNASTPDPLAILGVTQGQRKTDALEAFPFRERDLDNRYTCVFFVHGLRHRSQADLRQVSALPEGVELELRPEPLNPRDRNAIAAYAKGDSCDFQLGFIPRFLARDVASFPSAAIKLTVRRASHNAPLQQRVLCVLRAPWPVGFEP